jgi:transcription termination factor NusB
MNKEEIDVVLRQAWEYEREENLLVSIEYYDRALVALKELAENSEKEEQETLLDLVKDILVHVEDLRKAIQPYSLPPRKVKILPPPVNPVRPTHYEGSVDN